MTLPGVQGTNESPLMGGASRCCIMSKASTKRRDKDLLGINHRAAQMLRDAADLLETQDENPFRVNAYRRAASSVEALEVDLQTLIDTDGFASLLHIPGVGESIAASLTEIITTGHWAYLDRLRGSTSPEALFCTVRGIGPALARRLHETFHAETLEQLLASLDDATSERVAGLGSRRREGLRHAIAAQIKRTRPLRGDGEPSVDMILAVDDEYRRKALAGALPRIAPTRFNPSGAAWLPIMHVTRNGWHFTALYSNTARAHELGKTRDWVVIYVQSADGSSSQRTVVTQGHGPLAGERIVRGREHECLRHHQLQSSSRSLRNGTER